LSNIFYYLDKLERGAYYSSYVRVPQMKKQEYEHMKSELRRDYEEKLGALEKLWSVFGPRKLVAGDQSNGLSRSWDHELSKRDAVRAAIKEIHGDFTIHKVREALSHSQPAVSQDLKDNQISAIVSVLATNKEIDQVKPKSGKNPAVYKNKG
jgi:hypothetical protein